MDAMNNNDTDALHYLIGSLQKDINRILQATGDIGARIQRMDMLTSRHAESIITYSGIYDNEVGLDFSDAIVQFQAQQNVFDAALRVTGQFLQLSLVDYL